MLSEQQREQLISSLDLHKFELGEKIVREGDPGELFYIIKEGEVVATVDHQEIRRSSKGDFFGEQALLYDGVRTATVTAQGEVECLSVGRRTLEEVFGGSLKETLYKRSTIMALEKSASLEMLEKDQKEMVAEFVAVKPYKLG